MTIEPTQLISAATAYFHADQPRAALGFDSQYAAALGKELDFAEVGMAHRADQAHVWVARRGKLRRKDGTAITIQVAQGHELDLLAEVTGASHDAEEALAAVWKCLAGASAPALETIAAIHYRTLTVVELPRSFEELFPLTRVLRDTVVAHLAADGDKPSRPALPKFSIEIVTAVGGRTVNRTITFEPRATAPLEKRVYYVSSPLRSQDHMALLTHVAKLASK